MALRYSLLVSALLTSACTSPGPSSASSASPPQEASVAPRHPSSAAPHPWPSLDTFLVPAPPRSAEPPPDPAVPKYRKWTEWMSNEEKPLLRVDEAKKNKWDEVKRLFAEASVSFPPATIYFRAYKKEHLLELWAASRPDEALSLVATYGICYFSGELGPKRREGDLQVPEGLYKIKDLLPATPYYLGLHVDYPNLSDQILGDKRHPGGEILVHGKCVSVGCLAMGDERAAEIYVAASATRFAGGSLDIHIFPSREMDKLIASPEHAEHRAFWENLRPAHDAFEANHKVPRYRIDRDGRYRVLP